MKNGSFFSSDFLQICCRPTVTQLNMEFSNENIEKKIKLMKSYNLD